VHAGRGATGRPADKEAAATVGGQSLTGLALRYSSAMCQNAIMALRWQSIVVDSIDPQPLAAWWAELLGWRITWDQPDEVILEPPNGSPEAGILPDILFGLVPEKKKVKNRLHIDLRPDDHASEVARAEALGAVRVDVGQTGEESWVVLADPEGNEFCILRALTPEELAEG